MPDLTNHVSRNARRYLGTVGLGSVIAIVTLATDWPELAKVAALGIVALFVFIWRALPDADGNGLPDPVDAWLARKHPAEYEFLRRQVAQGLFESISEAIEYHAKQVVRRSAGGDDPKAQSHWLAAVAALALALSACASPLFLTLRADVDGRASVSATLDAYPVPVEVSAEGSGSAELVWAVGTLDAELTADAGVCAVATLGPWTLMAETCAESGSDKGAIIVGGKALPAGGQ